MASSLDKKSSRYIKGGTTESLPNRLGWWERDVMPFQNDDIIITIDTSIAGRPDLISYMAYGKVSYAWVVLQYNTILDIPNELKVGSVIRLPTPSRLL